MRLVPRRRLVLSAIAIVIVVKIVVAYLVGSWIAAPAPANVGVPPADLGAEAVTIESAGDRRLSGWWIDTRRACGVAVLMHPVRANRRSMLQRARFLSDAGFSVLLFDFQAHGESDGDQITFGFRESEDARAATAFARSQAPGLPVAVVGVSLGGIAATVAEPPVDADAFVLEAVAPGLTEATVNRVRLWTGPFAPAVTKALLVQVRPRLGFSPERIRPVDRIGGLGAPVLIIAGARDRRTTLEDSRALYDAAPEPKELWVVASARHVDFHRFDPVGYERRVAGFLSAYIGCPSTAR